MVSCGSLDTLTPSTLKLIMPTFIMASEIPEASVMLVRALVLT